MSLTIAVNDIVQGELERRWPQAGMDDAQTAEARAEYDHLRQVAEAMAEDVPQMARWAGSRSIVQRLLVAELSQLHPVELEQLVVVLAKAIARRDPTRYDLRFSESTQKLADTFRS